MSEPPIQLLLAFEAAARHASFKRAAEELHVTPSAISQQIKTLETHLGVPLFRRLPRAVHLNEDGAAFHRVATETLTSYRRSWSEFQAERGVRPIRLSTLPFVAYELLIPALHRLRSEHPTIDLRIETGLGLVDIAGGEADVGIRMGLGRYPGLSAASLVDLRAGLVCSPRLLTARGRLRASAIRETHLLLMPSLTKRVRERLEAAGLGGVLPERDLVFDSYLATMRAAERGLGVAVAVFPVIQSWLDAGRLATPTDDRFPIPERYHWVCRKGDEERPRIAAVREWAQEALASLGSPAAMPRSGLQ